MEYSQCLTSDKGVNCSWKPKVIILKQNTPIKIITSHIKKPVNLLNSQSRIFLFIILVVLRKNPNNAIPIRKIDQQTNSQITRKSASTIELPLDSVPQHKISESKSKPLPFYIPLLRKIFIRPKTSFSIKPQHRRVFSFENKKSTPRKKFLDESTSPINTLNYEKLIIAFDEPIKRKVCTPVPQIVEIKREIKTAKPTCRKVFAKTQRNSPSKSPDKWYEKRSNNEIGLKALKTLRSPIGSKSQCSLSEIFKTYLQNDMKIGSGRMKRKIKYNEKYKCPYVRKTCTTPTFDSLIHPEVLINSHEAGIENSSEMYGEEQEFMKLVNKSPGHKFSDDPLGNERTIERLKLLDAKLGKLAQNGTKTHMKASASAIFRKYLLNNKMLY